MKFDYDILFEFLSEEDKKHFLVWDNVIVSKTYLSIPGSFETIVATYRAPLEETILIDVYEYESKVKQKNRDININKILN
jgi:hypothetical protein